MRKEHVVAILVFGTIWGASEAILGGALYRAGVPHASIPLGVIAFAILTVARAYLPAAGASTLIACCAMCYKFLNAPFFACHLLGVVALGMGHDVMWSATRGRRDAWWMKALVGVGGTYLGFALFAVPITYVFRYPHWAVAGLPKVLRHVFVSGSLAALFSAAAVPAAAWLAVRLKAKRPVLVELRPTLVTGGLSLLVAGLWVLSACVAFS